MSYECVVVPGFLDVYRCRDTVVELKRRPWRDGKTPGRVGCKVRWIYPRDRLLGGLIKEVWKLASAANTAHFGLELTQLRALQVSEYEGAQRGGYAMHKDVLKPSRPLDLERKLTVIVQLSDPVANYDGGDLKLYGVDPEPDAAAMRALGTAIIFPSSADHELRPVTAGVRFSLAGWVEGPQ